MLTTGTIEEKIFQRQVLKQGLSGAIVDARESSQGHFTKEELKVFLVLNLLKCIQYNLFHQDLFTLREDTDCDTHDLINCTCIEKNLEGTCHGLDDYNFDLDDERECQLGVKPSKSGNSNKTVDQLLDWQHFGRPFIPEIFRVPFVIVCRGI